jgi:NAD(P)H-hydrate repair Nnr-like enzyme with NAD(P)H-hydrate dehydratase domain
VENINWSRQASDKPLFPDVLWSRPENKRHAGKLLIVGGHQQSFNAVSDTYTAAAKAGAGTIRVILPDKLEKMLSKLFPEAEFAPSTQIGSFGRSALDGLLDAAQWADAVLLAGDFGRNSETNIFLDSFVEKYSGKLAMAGDTLDYFLAHPEKLVNRKDTLIITDQGHLQKLASPVLIQQNVDFIKAIKQVGDWAKNTSSNIITSHSNQVIVCAEQQISTTPVKQKADITSLAAYASVWWLQQPGKTFEALTTAVYCL